MSEALGAIIGGLKLMITAGTVLYLYDQSSKQRVQRQRADREREQQWADEALELVASLTDETAEHVISSIAARWEFESFWKPKKNEPVYACAPVHFIDTVTEKRGGTFAGFTVNQKIAGPVRFRAGTINYAANVHKERRAVASGVLLVTSKRLAFSSMEGGKDWSKTWGSIATWNPTKDGIIVRQTNGPPLEFKIVSKQKWIPSLHPLYIDAVMDFASQR